MNFFADYRAGRATWEDIERYSQEWAAAPLGSPAAKVDLWDHLGMTFEQYTQWQSRGEIPEV